MEENKVEILVIEAPKIKVYTKLDTNKIIKEVNSSIFIQDLKDWTQIDEDDGIRDREIFSHAQSQYLGKGLMDSHGRYNYKWDNKLVELTEEEKNILFPPQEPQPKEIDILKEKNATLEKALFEMAELQFKEYENRKILENAVLDLANTIAGGN